MADDQDAGEAWDEYEWERFLQQQDRNADRYFQLLEKYMDHPDRDDLIAQEMGWDADDDEEFEECVEQFEKEVECELEPDEFDLFTQTPVYRDTLKLHLWIDDFFEENPSLRDHPEAVRLATRSAVCGAKLAAALCGEDQSELGMTIAFLKRGLKAANDSLDASLRLCEEGVLKPRQKAALNRRIFRLRNRIVDLMRDYRAEWRRRYGRTE